MKFEETAIERFWNQLRSDVKDPNDRVDVLLGVVAMEISFLSQYEPTSKEIRDMIINRYLDKCERIKYLTK